MRRPPLRPLTLVALASALSLGTVMCSGSDDAPGASSEERLVTGTYRGVFTGSGDVAGTAELTVSAPAPGAVAPASRGALADGASPYVVRGRLTLNVFGAPVDVEGSLDLATGVVTLTGRALGQPVTFTGRYDGGAIRGTLVTPLGTGPLVLTNEQLGPVRVHCGSFEGSRRGRVGGVVAGTFVGVAFAASDGQTASGAGTLEGTLANVTLEPGGSAAVTSTSAQLTGSWRFADGSGSFAASEAACAALTPPAPVDGGEPDGADGGPADGGPGDGALPDSGPPGTPETVIQLPGNVPVGHLAVGGGRLVYAPGYQTFMQRREILAVGVDGTDAATLVPVNDQASPQNVVAGLLVATGRAYWLASGTVSSDENLWSVPLAGGAPSDHGVVGGTPLSDDVAGRTRLATDGTNVFTSNYASFGSQFRSFVAATGAPVATLGPVDDLVGPSGIWIEGNDVVYGDFFGLRSTPKSLGGTFTTLVQKADYGQFDSVANVVADADALYFVSRETSAAKVWRRPKAGGAIAPVTVPYPGQIAGLALVGPHLYFAQRPAGGGQQGPAGATLVRVAKGATSATPSAVGAANFQDVVTDGTYVYYGEGQLVRRVRD